MAITQYIGSRYVPVFADPMEWSSENAYEPLTIVLYKGNSFTSKQTVPAGIDIDDTKYWAETGNYNAQVEQYRVEIKEGVANCEVYAEEASNSATAATNSAADAKASATAAATSATAAATSAQQTEDAKQSAVTAVKNQETESVAAVKAQETESIAAVKAQETESIAAVKAQETESVAVVDAAKKYVAKRGELTIEIDMSTLVKDTWTEVTTSIGALDGKAQSKNAFVTVSSDDGVENCLFNAFVYNSASTTQSPYWSVKLYAYSLYNWSSISGTTRNFTLTVYDYFDIS